jgi:hypothetical protein
MKKFFGFGSSTPPPAPATAGSSAMKEASSSTSGIVGRWKDSNGNDTTEFRSDGTVVEQPASGELIRGRYSLEGTRLKITLEGLPKELLFVASIKDDALEIKDPDGQITEYRRL